MSTITITSTSIAGNLISDPDLRYTAQGAAVATVTIVHTPRVFNRETRSWENGQPLFLRASAWRDMAENMAETLHKGDRVIATGTLTQRSYNDKQGNPRTVIELQIEEIGVSLRYARAAITRNTSNPSITGITGNGYGESEVGYASNSPNTFNTSVSGGRDADNPRGQIAPIGQPMDY